MKDERLEDILEGLGEENAMKMMGEGNMHTFSKEYEEKKKQLINQVAWMEEKEQQGKQEKQEQKKQQEEKEKQEEKERQEQREKQGEQVQKVEKVIAYRGKKKKLNWKTLLVAAAIVTISTVTVCAAVNYYRVSGQKDEQTGTYAYTYYVEGEKNIPAIKITPNYIPEGYAECEVCGEGKYQPIGENDHTTGFSIIASNLYNKEEIPYVSKVEHIQINGIKSDILTRDGVEFNHILMMFYEEEGQVIQIYATDDITVDELTKIGENITYAVDESVDANQSMDVFVEQEIFVEEPVQVELSDIIQVGDKKESATEGITYTVKKLEVQDALPDGLSETGFLKQEDISDYVNEDSSMKDYEREVETWEDNQLKKEVQSVGLKCIDVTLEVTNTKKVDIAEVAVQPRIRFLEKNSEGLYGEIQDEEFVGNIARAPLSADRMPFYFDQTDFSGEKHFYYMGMKALETKEVHLLFALEEDVIDQAYLAFGLDSGERASYLKIQK